MSAEVEMDKMEGGGSQIVRSNSDPNRVEDIQLDTEQALHTGRAGEDEEVEKPTEGAAETQVEVEGKQEKSFFAKYKIPIIIILIVILISIIAASISGALISDVDEESDANVEVLMGGDTYTNGDTKPVPVPVDPASCPKSKFEGYFPAQKKCGECFDDTIFNEETGKCDSVLPCEANEILQGTVCVACPMWQEQIDGKCLDRCRGEVGAHWDGSKCTNDFYNGCRHEDNAFFKLNDKKTTEFDDKCTGGCNKLFMFTQTDKTKPDAFQPKAVECCSNDQCSPAHGVATDDLKKVMIGYKDACIYKVEKQVKEGSDQISALRFYWRTKEEDGINHQTLGKYDPTMASTKTLFNGCLLGLKGNKDEEGQITELGFNFQSELPWRCGLERWWPGCECHGDIFMGPYTAEDGETVLSFDQMKNTGNYVIRPNAKWGETINCEVGNFPSDPAPWGLKQCFCMPK